MCPVSARLVNGHGGWLAPARMICHCWLIETNDGLVLVDTGLGSEDLKHPRKRLGRMVTLLRPEIDPQLSIIAQLAGLGFSPRDVRHIIPTHLDLDHAGGLPDFPEATVHVFAAEQRAALQRATWAERERYRVAHFVHGVHWDPRSEQGERWFGFDGVRAMDSRDDILLIPLQGHSRGHCAVAVRTGDRWLVHAGDAYFFHGEMTPDDHCPPGLKVFQQIAAFDNRQRLANRERLRELVREHGSQVEVHSAHCPVEFERHAGTREA